MKLKEVNRGLVLGLALLVGVVFHVNWQNHKFKKDIPVIQSAVEEYGQEVLKSSLGDAKGLKRRTTAAIQNAYTGKCEIPEYVYASKSTILAEIDSIDTNTFEGTLYDAEFKVLDLKAKKSGSGARVDVSYELDFTFSGMPTYVDISGVNIISPWGTAPNDKKRKIGQEGTMNLYMKKDGGSWKVAYVNYNYTYSENEEFVGDTASDDIGEVIADD